MSLLNKSLKVLLLGTTLMTSAKAADLTLTVDAYTALADKIAVGTAESDKAFEISGVSGSGLNKGLLGTVTASGESYVWSNSTTAPTSIKVLALLYGGSWFTFEKTSLGVISASGPVSLLLTKVDGDDATGLNLTINLTKTTGAPITSLAFVNFLKANLTTANRTFAEDAPKQLSVSPPAGWTATAVFHAPSGANTPLAATLDPIAFTLTVPVTPAAGGTAVNFSVALPDISAFNVGSDDEYSSVQTLTSGPNTLTIALKPGKIADPENGIMADLVADANALTRRRLKTEAPYTYQTLSSAVDYVNSQFATTPGNASTDTLGETVDVILGKIGAGATVVQTGIQDVLDAMGGAGTLSQMVLDNARSYVAHDLFAVADCDDLVADTGMYGLVAFKNTVTGLSGWQAKGSKVIVTSTVDGAVKEFTCDVSGLQKFLNATESGTQKKVLEFTSTAGDVFWIRAFDTTGLNTIAFTGSISFKDDFLALLIADKFSLVTSITGKSFADLKAASESL